MVTTEENGAKKGIAAFAMMVLITGALTALFAHSCGPRETSLPAAQAAPSFSTNKTESVAQKEQRFKTRGIIQELKPGEREVVIKHETITNYMPAMTMPFEVKNTNELSGLSTNDQVSFTLVVTENDGWIENLKRIGTSPEPAERPNVRIVRDVQPLAVGDKMPDYSFTNSLGRTVKLSDFAGQAYTFTFVFTRCPFPTFCPRMNSNFAETYKQLMSRSSGPTNWHLLTISFDPDFDTPERLREYSAHYNPDPKKWDWLTGAMIDIDAITDQFGLIFASEKGTINHTLRTVVIDKNRKVRNIYIGNEWSTDELVESIIAAAQAP